VSAAASAAAAAPLLSEEIVVETVDSASVQSTGSSPSPAGVTSIPLVRSVYSCIVPPTQKKIDDDDCSSVNSAPSNGSRSSSRSSSRRKSTKNASDKASELPLDATTSPDRYAVPKASAASIALTVRDDDEEEGEEDREAPASSPRESPDDISEQLLASAPESVIPLVRSVYSYINPPAKKNNDSEDNDSDTVKSEPTPPRRSSFVSQPISQPDKYDTAYEKKLKLKELWDSNAQSSSALVSGSSALLSINEEDQERDGDDDDVANVATTEGPPSSEKSDADNDAPVDTEPDNNDDNGATEESSFAEKIDAEMNSRVDICVPEQSGMETVEPEERTSSDDRGNGEISDERDAEIRNPDEREGNAGYDADVDTVVEGAKASDDAEKKPKRSSRGSFLYIKSKSQGTIDKSSTKKSSFRGSMKKAGSFLKKKKRPSASEEEVAVAE